MEIKAFVKAVIYLSPKNVYLRGPAGQKVSGTVSVRAGEEQPLKLEVVGFTLSDRVTYTMEEVQPGRFFVIRFSTIPGPPGNYRGVLRLKTNYPERTHIAIPITASLHSVGKAQKGRGN